MKRSGSLVLAWLVLCSSSGAADAQPAYVGASILADVVRASGSEPQPGSGEAIGGALRVGAPLGDRWGVDLDFARSGEIEWRPDVRILADISRSVPDLVGVLPDIAIFPAPEISVQAQLSTLTTMLWWRQPVTERFDLVYLGGAAFTRTATDSRVSYGQVRPLRPGGVSFPQLFEQEAVGYDTGVAVGLDGRMAMTDHLRLVPGLRLLTVASRWVIRPSVGLMWSF